MRVRVRPQGRPLRAGAKIRQSASLPLQWPEPRGLRAGARGGAGLMSAPGLRPRPTPVRSKREELFASSRMRGQKPPAGPPPRDRPRRRASALHSLYPRSAGSSVSLAQGTPFGTCPWAPSPPGPWPGGLIPSVGPRVAERCPGGEVAKVPYCCTLVSFWTPFWYPLFADFC